MTTIITTAISGLAIGLLGSFHCIGMCGPLAMTLPVNNLNGETNYLRVLAYNLGRAITYAGFGFIFGLIGNSFSFFGWQQNLSIVSGIIMLLFVFFNYTSLSKIGIVQNVNFFAKKYIAKYLLVQPKTSSIFLIGLLNGLLPCGLVYMALTTALATGSAFNGAIIMFSFGLGTIPAMAALMIFKKYISFNFRRKIKLVTPYLIASVALLLIIRGLNLGIPYLSPQLQSSAACVIKCCH